MNESTAAANLAVIRTLMERSAVYRRALVPILFTAGTVAVLAAILGALVRIDTIRDFYSYWTTVGIVVLLVAFGVARRQASHDREAFWSAPTRRVAQALALPLFAGAVLTFFLVNWEPRFGLITLIGVWLLLYGCAIHAAGFFTPRGMQVLGWLFGLAGVGLGVCFACDTGVTPALAHACMAVTFGGFHLAYALYLKATGTGSADA